MNKSARLEIIKEYFSAWVKKDESIIPKIFAEDIVYTECMGTVYMGKAQCMRWFSDWNQKGSVLKWDIQRTFDAGDTVIVQWFFECDYENNIDGFNGVSLIEFDSQGLIASVNEYYAKAELDYPYEKISL